MASIPKVSFLVKMTYRAEDKAKADEAIRAMIPPTLQEPGCVNYIAHWMVEDPNTLSIYEQYVDQAAREAHSGSAYFKQWVEGVLVPLRTAVVFEYMEMIG